jgi:hypothetical protein
MPRWNKPVFDKDYRVAVYRCDICNDRIADAPDDFEAHIQLLDDIDSSFESELDRSTYEQGPKLILCDYCQKEYMIPGYPMY